jgi:hypothetical protein
MDTFIRNARAFAGASQLGVAYNEAFAKIAGKIGIRSLFVQM